MTTIPRMLRVRQRFPRPIPPDIPRTLATEMGKLLRGIRPGARIAIGVGSRGIAGLAEIVRESVASVRTAGAEPFLIPAMGSHGGATPEGQAALLAEYGVTEATAGARIYPSMEARIVGTTEDGADVWCGVEALGADGIILINRVKPHTDFSGELGSGLLKMCVIGMGKHAGALSMHRAASRLGHEHVIRSMARVLVARTPVLGGIAILENQHHETARLVAVRAAEMEATEHLLLREARDLLPRLPFDEIDLLIIDRIGKNISGTGMDPNVVGRGVQGYSSDLQRDGRPSPFIRRIFVRGLSPETHGNAIGIGLADATTDRLVRAIDRRVTYLNSLTALTPQCAKIPLHFGSDREAIERMLQSLALVDPATARLVRIADTLSPADLEISEPVAAELGRFPHIEVLRPAAAVAFDEEGNLGPL